MTKPERTLNRLIAVAIVLSFGGLGVAFYSMDDLLEHGKPSFGAGLVLSFVLGCGFGAGFWFGARRLFAAKSGVSDSKPSSPIEPKS